MDDLMARQLNKNINSKIIRLIERQNESQTNIYKYYFFYNPFDCVSQK